MDQRVARRCAPLARIGMASYQPHPVDVGTHDFLNGSWSDHVENGWVLGLCGRLLISGESLREEYRQAGLGRKRLLVSPSACYDSVHREKRTTILISVTLAVIS